MSQKQEQYQNPPEGGPPGQNKPDNTVPGGEQTTQDPSITVMPSINEPPGSDVLPNPAQAEPAPEANPAKPWANEDEEEPPPEAAHLEDPDEMEAELEEAEDEDDLVVTRTTHTKVHRGTPAKTLPKHRKK